MATVGRPAATGAERSAGAARSTATGARRVGGVGKRAGTGARRVVTVAERVATAVGRAAWGGIGFAAVRRGFGSVRRGFAAGARRSAAVRRGFATDAERVAAVEGWVGTDGKEVAPGGGRLADGEGCSAHVDEGIASDAGRVATAENRVGHVDESVLDRETLGASEGHGIANVEKARPPGTPQYSEPKRSRELGWARDGSGVDARKPDGLLPTATRPTHLPCKAPQRLRLHVLAEMDHVLTLNHGVPGGRHLLGLENPVDVHLHGLRQHTQKDRFAVLFDDDDRRAGGARERRDVNQPVGPPSKSTAG